MSLATKQSVTMIKDDKGSSDREVSEEEILLRSGMRDVSAAGRRSSYAIKKTSDRLLSLFGINSCYTEMDQMRAHVKAAAEVLVDHAEVAKATEVVDPAKSTATGVGKENVLTKKIEAAEKKYMQELYDNGNAESLPFVWGEKLADMDMLNVLDRFKPKVDANINRARELFEVPLIM